MQYLVPWVIVYSANSSALPIATTLTIALRRESVVFSATTRVILSLTKPRVAGAKVIQSFASSGIITSQLTFV